MAYTEILYGSTDTDPLSAPVAQTQAELEEGLKCGRLDLPALKGTLAKIFADLKFIHDADDFLEQLTITADPADATRFVIGGDMNNAEDSIDGGFGVSFAEPIVATLTGTELSVEIDYAKLFSDPAFKTALCAFIITHWKDINGDLHFANGCDAAGDPTFAP